MTGSTVELDLRRGIAVRTFEGVDVTNRETAKRCFVISPIGPEHSDTREHADDVFDFIIKPAMEELNVSPLRSDHLHEPGLISEQMLRAILEYDMCIAVLTFHNPNVFYELAIAQAARRPVIILLEKESELPFDIKDMRCVYYDLKLRPVFERLYSDQIVKHVRSLEEAGWPASGPLDHLLLAADESPYKVLSKANEFGGPEAWLELLAETEHEFAVAGINLHDWRKTMHFQETVTAKLGAGCRVRVMLIHPDNPSLPGLINERAASSSFNEVLAGVAESRSYFQRFADSHDNFELREMRVGCPHSNLTINDQRAVALPYLFCNRTALSPALISPAGSPLFATFQREFDSLWDANGSPAESIEPAGAVTPQETVVRSG
jgi:hypothetical protein